MGQFQMDPGTPWVRVPAPQIPRRGSGSRATLHRRPWPGWWGIVPPPPRHASLLGKPGAALGARAHDLWRRGTGTAAHGFSKVVAAPGRGRGRGLSFLSSSGLGRDCSLRADTVSDLYPPGVCPHRFSRLPAAGPPDLQFPARFSDGEAGAAEGIEGWRASKGPRPPGAPLLGKLRPRPQGAARHRGLCLALPARAQSREKQGGRDCGERGDRPSVCSGKAESTQGREAGCVI